MGRASEGKGRLPSCRSRQECFRLPAFRVGEALTGAAMSAGEAEVAASMLICFTRASKRGPKSTRGLRLWAAILRRR